MTGPAGTRTYAELAADAAAFGAGLLSLGLQRGDRVLLFLDDTPAYPAALFGAIRAGLVPLLINTLTPPDLLQFYLSNSGATVAICDAAFVDRFNATACDGTRLETLVVTNGEAPAPAAVPTQSAAPWLAGPPPTLAPADTHRDDMAFWMYSSGSTGRPKGIVHLQHDMAYTHLSYARHLLGLTERDICFSVPKIFFAYGLGNSITFPFSVGASSVLLPGQPKPAAIFDGIARYRPTVFFGLPTLYTALTKAPEAKTADLASLRLAVSAAEILSAEVFNAWKAMSGLEIMEGLGSTEVLHIYLSNTPQMQQARRRGQARAGLRGGAEGQRRARGGGRRGGHPVGARRLPTAPATGTGPTRRPRPCARAAGSTPATASCATPTASTSSAAGPTTSSRSRGNGSIRWRWSCASPTIRPCASAPCWPWRRTTSSPRSRPSSC